MKRKRQSTKKQTVIVVGDDTPVKKTKISLSGKAKVLTLLIVWKAKPQETATIPFESELPPWSELVAFIKEKIGVENFSVRDENLCQKIKPEEWDNYPWATVIIKEKGATLLIEGEADITPDVGIIDAFNADMEPLVALTEIIDNCIEATSDPKVNDLVVGRKIKIETNRDNAELVIEDNGTGMAHLKLLHYGRYGLSQHKNESAEEFATQEKLGRFSLTSKFGRYGIGAKSAAFHLGKEAVIETLSLHSKVVSVLVLNMTTVKSWKAPEKRREATKEELETGHFTRMTIKGVHKQFWQDLDEGNLKEQLADVYYFYMFGEPYKVMELPQDIDSTFIPVDITLDGASLTDCDCYIKEVMTKADKKFTWEFSFPLRMTTVHCFLFYFPFTEGQESLPIPYEVRRNKSQTELNKMPASDRQARLLYFWLGRYFPQASPPRLPFVLPGRRRKVDRIRIPDRCYDRILGLLLFDGNIGATSHKTRFSNTDEVYRALTSEDMNKKIYKDLKKQLDSKLNEWHKADNEALVPPGEKCTYDVDTEICACGVINYRGRIWKKGCRIKLKPAQGRQSVYGTIEEFHISEDPAGSSVIVTEFDRVLLANREATEGYLLEQIEDEMSKAAWKKMKLESKKHHPAKLELRDPTSSKVRAGEDHSICVVVKNGKNEVIDRPFKHGIEYIQLTVAFNGEPLPEHTKEAKPYKGKGGVKGGFYWTYPFIVGIGTYKMTWTPMLMDNQPLNKLRLEVSFTAYPGEPAQLCLRWRENQDKEKGKETTTGKQAKGEGKRKGKQNNDPLANQVRLGERLPTIMVSLRDDKNLKIRITEKDYEKWLLLLKETKPVLCYAEGEEQVPISFEGEWEDYPQKASALYKSGPLVPSSSFRGQLSQPLKLKISFAINTTDLALGETLPLNVCSGKPCSLRLVGKHPFTSVAPLSRQETQSKGTRSRQIKKQKAVVEESPQEEGSISPFFEEHDVISGFNVHVLDEYDNVVYAQLIEILECQNCSPFSKVHRVEEGVLSAENIVKVTGSSGGNGSFVMRLKDHPEIGLKLTFQLAERILLWKAKTIKKEQSPPSIVKNTASAPSSSTGASADSMEIDGREDMERVVQLAAIAGSELRHITFQVTTRSGQKASNFDGTLLIAPVPPRPRSEKSIDIKKGTVTLPSPICVPTSASSSTTLRIYCKELGEQNQILFSVAAVPGTPARLQVEASTDKVVSGGTMDVRLWLADQHGNRISDADALGKDMQLQFVPVADDGCEKGQATPKRRQYKSRKGKEKELEQRDSDGGLPLVHDSLPVADYEPSRWQVHLPEEDGCPYLEYRDLLLEGKQGKYIFSLASSTNPTLRSSPIVLHLTHGKPARVVNKPLGKIYEDEVIPLRLEVLDRWDNVVPPDVTDTVEIGTKRKQEPFVLIKDPECIRTNIKDGTIGIENFILKLKKSELKTVPPSDEGEPCTDVNITLRFKQLAIDFPLRLSLYHAKFPVVARLSSGSSPEQLSAIAGQPFSVKVDLMGDGEPFEAVSEQVHVDLLESQHSRRDALTPVSGASRSSSFLFRGDAPSICGREYSCVVRVEHPPSMSQRVYDSQPFIVLPGSPAALSMEGYGIVSSVTPGMGLGKEIRIAMKDSFGNHITHLPDGITLAAEIKSPSPLGTHQYVRLRLGAEEGSRLCRRFQSFGAGQPLVSVWDGLAIITNTYGTMQLVFAACPESADEELRTEGNLGDVPSMALSIAVFDGEKMKGEEKDLIERINQSKQKKLALEEALYRERQRLEAELTPRFNELRSQKSNIDQQITNLQHRKHQLEQHEQHVIRSQLGNREARLSGAEPRAITELRRAWQNYIHGQQQQSRNLQIHWTLADIARVANPRLANMLNAHLGGHMNLVIVENSETRDWIWQSYPRVTVSVLSNMGLQRGWQECLTQEGLMRFVLKKDKKSFVPSKTGSVFPHALAGSPITKEMNCYFAVNMIYLPSDQAKWRPFLYKILGPTLIVASTYQARAYLDRMHDTPQTILTLDEDVRDGGDKFTSTYQSHCILKDFRSQSPGFRDLTEEERLSDQQLSMSEEGKQLLQGRRLVGNLGPVQKKGEEVTNNLGVMVTQMREAETKKKAIQAELGQEMRLLSKLGSDLKELNK